MSDDPNAERAEILTLLQAIVPPIGVVNDRERVSLVSLLDATDGNKLHGYNITNADPNGRNVEEITSLTTGAYTIKRTWTIRGFYQIDDEGGSEKLFRAELHAIRKKLAPNRSLGHTVLSTQFPTITTFVPTEGEGYSFHYAEVVFQTRTESFYDPV